MLREVLLVKSSSSIINSIMLIFFKTLGVF